MLGQNPHAHTRDQSALAFASPMLPAHDNKKKKELPPLIYDYKAWEEDWEVKQYNQFLAKQERLYKKLHNSYCNDAGVKKPLAVGRTTFDDNEKTYD